MSSEWSTLEEVADVIDSLHKTPTYSECGLPMVRGTDVKYGELNLTQTFNVDKDTFSEFSRRYKPAFNDIIITRVGSYGITARVTKTEFCLGQNTSAIVPTEINPRYLYSALNSSLIWSQIESGVVGSTQKTLSLKVIKALKIPRHGENSETEIATILGTLDDRITLLRETNATLEAIAQALFKSWFVDFDPVHAKAQGRQPEGMDEQTAALFPDRFVESELGMVPLGWEVGTLGDISKNNSEPFNFSKFDKVIFVNTGDVSNGEFLHKNYSSKESLPGQAKKAIFENDILFSEIRPKNGRFAYVNFDSKDYVVSTKFMVLRAINDIPPRYLYQILKQTETVEYFNIIAESRSGTFPQITFDSIKSYKLIRPSKVCLEKYIACVEPIFHKIDLLNKQIQTLANLRDTLLPRLISGQLRLPDVVDHLGEI
jgi:type I restriction enzyme S subunit